MPNPVPEKGIILKRMSAFWFDKMKDIIGNHIVSTNPAEFPEDQITDLYEKEIAAELIREACLVFLRDEVPHALAVRLDEFSERENCNAYIAATLLVEHDSQKGIVIGEKAAMLKKIGLAARMEIESMSGRKVFLELRVKVDKDWRDDENALRRLGYKVKGKK